MLQVVYDCLWRALQIEGWLRSTFERALDTFPFDALLSVLPFPPCERGGGGSDGGGPSSALAASASSAAGASGVISSLATIAAAAAADAPLEVCLLSCSPLCPSQSQNLTNCVSMSIQVKYFNTVLQLIFLKFLQH